MNKLLKKLHSKYEVCKLYEYILVYGMVGNIYKCKTTYHL
jgi:hypothetical protein